MLNKWFTHNVKTRTEINKKSLKETIIHELGLCSDHSYLLPHYIWGNRYWCPTKFNWIFRNCRCHSFSQVGWCSVHGLPLQGKTRSQNHSHIPYHRPGCPKRSFHRFRMDYCLVGRHPLGYLSIPISRNLPGHKHNVTAKLTTAP